MRAGAIFFGVSLFLLPKLSFACIDLGVTVETGSKFPGVSVVTTAMGFQVTRMGTTYNFEPKVTSKGHQWCYTEGQNAPACLDPEKYKAIGKAAENGDQFGAVAYKEKDGRSVIGLVNSPDPKGRDENVRHEQMVFSYGFTVTDKEGKKIDPKHLTNNQDEFEEKNGLSETTQLVHDMKVTLQEKKLSTGIDTWFTNKLGSLSLNKKLTVNGERSRAIGGPKMTKADLSSGDYEGVPDQTGCQSEVQPVKKQAKAAVPGEPSLSSIASVPPRPTSKRVGGASSRGSVDESTSRGVHK